MSILVANCFDWIGFHLVNYLLENGFQVHGVDELKSTKKEHLSMFFARNDRFIFTTVQQIKDEEKVFDTAFIIDEYDINPIQAKQTIAIRNQEKCTYEDKTIVIEVPILFGEWMSMCENGVYKNNQFIRFDSEQFLNDAIYINDFIQGLMARVENKNLFPMLHVLSIKCRQKHIKLENVFYIRDNRPIEENIKKVTEHYKRYRHFYK
ncbi:MAG TPA: hypothetical protein VK119_02245 [Bacillota bacterium]|nr:hypothetical protein [Bacillota bacterium]